MKDGIKSDSKRESETETGMRVGGRERKRVIWREPDSWERVWVRIIFRYSLGRIYHSNGGNVWSENLDAESFGTILSLKTFRLKYFMLRTGSPKVLFWCYTTTSQPTLKIIESFFFLSNRKSYGSHTPDFTFLAWPTERRTKYLQNRCSYMRGICTEIIRYPA